MLKMFSEFSKCCYREDLSKCCRGCEFSMLQMLQYCGRLKMLLECCRVLFRKRFFNLQKLIIIIITMQKTVLMDSESIIRRVMSGLIQGEENE